MTNITIEQLRSDKWVAEVEVGGFVAKRERLAAASRKEMMGLVNEACDRLEAQDPKRPPVVQYENVPLEQILADERMDATWSDVPDDLDHELRKTEEEVAEIYHNEPTAHIAPEAAPAPSPFGPHNLPKRGRPRKVS